MTDREPKLEMRRVVVVGTSGSGKTRLARDLSLVLEATHIELDTLHWKPSWIERPTDEFRLLVEEAVSADRWVVDGNYSAVRDLVWGRATDVVWLDYPFALVFTRALRRTIRRAVSGEEIFSGNRESFRQSFLSRDSILLWVLQTHRGNRARYASLRDADAWRHLRFHRLRGPSEASSLVSRCGSIDLIDPGRCRAAY